MEKLIDMDDLETFVLDFLAYRRERRLNTPPQPTHSPPKLLEYNPAPAEPPPKAANIPYSIGKGWPHYKAMAKGYQTHAEPPPEPAIPASQSDIIPTLAPIVTQNLQHFGSPASPKALEHLVCQVIASAMAVPLISESIHTAEITPWGRVPLLQAVVELLILLQIREDKR